MSDSKPYSEMTLAEKLDYERAHHREETPYDRLRAARPVTEYKCLGGCGTVMTVTTAGTGLYRVLVGPRYCPACLERLGPEWEKARTKREAEANRQREIEATERRRNWLYASGVPAHYQGRGFLAFDRSAQPGAYDLCKQYADGLTVDSYRGYRSLVLTSPYVSAAEPGNGVGKTHLACAIAQEMMGKWPTESWRMCPVTVTTESDLYLRIRATYSAPHYHGEGPPPETEQGIINIMCRVPLLVLDDLGKQAPADPRWSQSKLFDIINGRCNNRLPMVITANLSESGLRAYLGGSDNQAIIDRLIQMCGGEINVMSGKSWRRR